MTQGMHRRGFIRAGLLLALAASVPAGRAQNRPPWRVVFSQDTLANDWRRAQAEGLEREFRRYPRVQFRYTDADGNTARQIQDIEDAIEQGIDLLIVSARDAELTAPVVARAKARGIRVILLSRRVASDAYDCFIRADNHAVGRQAARYLAGRLKGKGSILVLQGIPTASTAIERTAGFAAELKRFPGLRIAATKPADYLRDKALVAVEEVLAQGIRFDAVFAQSDSMAVGARLALQAAGIDPKTLPLIGVDYIAEARRAILAGEQDASFVYPTFAREAVQAAMQILAGRPVPRDIVAPARLVTRADAAQVAPIF